MALGLAIIGSGMFTSVLTRNLRGVRYRIELTSDRHLRQRGTLGQHPALKVSAPNDAQ